MVFKRGDNWYTDVRYHYTDDEGTPRTKRLKKKIGPKKADAVTAEAMLRSQIASGTYDPAPPVIVEAPRQFSTFVDEFLEWSQMQHSEAHHSQLRRWLKGRIGAVFGDLTLHEITTKRITDYMQARIGQSYKANGWHSSKRTSAATVNRELAAIKVVLSQAVAWGRIAVSPASGVASLKETPNPPQLLSGGEIARLLAEMPDDLRAAVGVAVYAGLRRAEIMRLRWEHVDLKAGVLTVASRSAGRTKSNRDRRVPISADLAELLRRHPCKLGARLLFPNIEGGVRHDFRTALVAAGKRAGIGKVGMHQLRHAFVSHALMQGADPRSVQKWCGHADLATTMRYAHTSPDHEREAIGKVRYEDDAEGRGGRAIVNDAMS